MKTIYLIHGKQRTGKGTIATFLSNQEGGVKRLKYADAVKSMVAVMLQEAGYTENLILHEMLESIRKEQKLKGTGGYSSRDLQRAVGSEFRGYFNTQLWREILEARVALHMKESFQNIIIDDVRFAMDIPRIQQLAKGTGWNVVTIKVTRDNVEEGYIPPGEPKAEKDIFAGGSLSMSVNRKCIDKLFSSMDSFGMNNQAQCYVTDSKSREDLQDYLRWACSSIKTKGGEGHSSEAGLPDEGFDHVISNDGNLSELKGKLKNCKLAM